MRKKFFAGALIGVLLVAASVAVAASPQYKQSGFIKLTSGKANKVTGLKVSLSAKDPGDPINENNVPPVDTVTVKLPKGSSIDPSAARALCKEPQVDAEKCAQSAPKSEVGDGTAKAVLVGKNDQGQTTVSEDKIDNKVRAFARKGGIFLVVKATGIGSTTILNAKTTKKGLIKVFVKRDVKPILGNNIVLTDFTLNVDKVKRGKKMLLRTPKKCPKGGKKLVSTVRLTYTGEEPHTVTGKQKCSGGKKKKR